MDVGTVLIVVIIRVHNCCDKGLLIQSIGRTRDSELALQTLHLRVEALQELPEGGAIRGVGIPTDKHQILIDRLRAVLGDG